MEILQKNLKNELKPDITDNVNKNALYLYSFFKETVLWKV